MNQMHAGNLDIIKENYSEYNCWFQQYNSSNIDANAVDMLKKIVPLGNGRVLNTAAEELRNGLKHMFNIDSSISSDVAGPCLILGTADNLKRITNCITDDTNDRNDINGINDIIENMIKAPRDGEFSIVSCRRRLIITGSNESAVLYGVFRLLMLTALGKNLLDLKIHEKPASSLRMINHWDNMNGTIERGYSGKSLFYDNGNFKYDPKRIRDYARLLASIGINAISINNVNVHRRETYLITEELLPQVANLADIFRDYGIRLIICINYASPIRIGGLDTADPFDKNVRTWWENQANIIYSYIPDLLGFLVKADSEFSPGPFSYGRNHADGANVLARALKQHGGVVIWRCFVYNCQQDWRDTKTDRPKFPYESFMPLDGKFDDNVLLQIKFGPMDFQVREPVSPLLGAMKHTQQVLELQITQEYTGQQRDLYCLTPQWKEILDFDTKHGEHSRIMDMFGNKITGVAGVSNVGTDLNWTGHTLAQANLYSFGRLAWNPALSGEEIIDEWVRLTFGANPEVIDTISGMLLKSRSIYEKYTSPLGIGWMVNPGHHYGPNVDGYEYSPWGTYHRASHDAIGIDRTAKGTGFTAQYSPEVAAMYDDPKTCPEELLLFFHRLPYTYRLKSGKTIIQHIYDTHFEAVEEVKEMIAAWESLKGKIHDDVFQSVRKRFDIQLRNAIEWRDVINTYFYRKTGIPDEKGRLIYP